MRLNIYCSKCDNLISVRVDPSPDTFSWFKKIRRSWLSVHDALALHGWLLDDFGTVTCPEHNTAVAVRPEKIRGRRTSEFKIWEKRDSGRKACFNVAIPVRKLERFKFATFFVPQTIEEIAGVLLEQFSDYILSGNLREKSEAAYLNKIQDMKEAKEEQALNDYLKGYEDASQETISGEKRKKPRRKYRGELKDVIRTIDNPEVRRGFPNWRPGA